MNGGMTTLRRPPQWTLNDDTNGNRVVDDGEQRYPTDAECLANPAFDCLTATRSVTDDMLNRFQNWDLLYGRVWGPRNFQGRWFAGLRYFVYEGNVLAGAWLNDAVPGEGFTDGGFLRLLNFSQDMSGLGPTGLLEARWNFFNQRLQLYLNGQASFLIANVSADTGAFFTLVNVTSTGVVAPIPARLDEERDKSVWNTKAEIGLRLVFKSGLEVEAAYMAQGYLDAVLNPETIQIPQDIGQADQGISAVYTTQDIVLDAFRIGVGFQF
jgi:hypothetical protein